MRHVRFGEYLPRDGAPAEQLSLGALDGLSQELAASAATGDERLRLLHAMKLLGDIRDILVAPMSAEGGKLIDQAIHELMRQERDVPADWRC